MGKTRAASHDASQYLISESAMNQIWSHFETKLNDWISNTLPQLTKDLIMSYANSAVNEYVSSTQFKKSIPETLQFEVGNLQETTKSSQETIAGLEEANAVLREQLDDLEQYTRRTNIRIFGIPEPTGTDPEDTNAKAIEFFANQLGITVSADHISRSHRNGKRGRTPRLIIVRLVHYKTKVQLLRKRRELKARETNFDIWEDLTQCRRDILHYFDNDITEGIIDKVWTIERIIFMRPTSRSSVIEKCTTLRKCREIVNKYSWSATEANSALSRRYSLQRLTLFCHAMYSI